MKHSKLCLIGLLPLVFFLGCSFQTSSTKLRLAEKYVRDRQYKAARDEYKKVYDREGLTPLGLTSLKQLANVEFLYTRDYESALQHLNYYSKVIKDNEEVEWSIYSMAEIYFSKFENYREALIMYRRIFERFPKSSYVKESLYKMAVSYERMSNFDKALSLFKSLEDQESGDESSSYGELAHFERANILYLKGSLKEALSSFEAYLKKYPNGRKAGAALFNLGNIYEDQGDFELAAAYYSKVKARDSSLTSITALRLSRLTARKNRHAGS